MAAETFTLKSISVLAAAFPNAKITKETIDVYVAALADMGEDILGLACVDCVSTCKWFPTVAEIRERAANIMAATDLLPPANEAWGTFIRLASRHEHMPENMDNPILEKTIRAMGWNYLVRSENGMADRARFVELYDQYLLRRKREYVAAPAVMQAQNKALIEMRGLAKQLAAPKGEQ